MSEKKQRNRITEFLILEYQKLVNYVRRKVDSAADMEAEDIVQSVAENLFKRADVGAPIENLSAYVYRSLQNEVASLFRKQKETISMDQPLKNRDVATLADVLRLDEHHRKTELQSKETSDELYELLSHLNEEERALVIATELEGYSFRELSESWNVSINTLLSKKARAIKKLMAIATQF